MKPSVDVVEKGNLLLGILVGILPVHFSATRFVGIYFFLVHHIQYQSGNTVAIVVICTASP
jgi:hypothetical protein